MFNLYSVPTFGTMLLFLILASYIFTRSPRNRISQVAVAAQLTTAAYLLGQGMEANATTLGQWLPWARNFIWGATVAPTLWYWLTLLLLREQLATPSLYLRRIGYPLGLLFALVSFILTVSIYTGDWLYAWSATVPVPSELAHSFRFHTPAQPPFVIFIVLVAGTTLGAAVNVRFAWRQSTDGERHVRFGWLFFSAILFILGANSLTISTWISMAAWFAWLGHIELGAAMLIMAWTIAAYSLLIERKVIRRDFFYFLTTLTFVCVIYSLPFIISGLEYSFPALEALVLTLILAVLSHALMDMGRHLSGRLFFGSDVQRLRVNLTTMAQTAALAQDLGALLDEAKAEIDEVSIEHFFRLTEEALRRLNNPAALAKCELISKMPQTLASIHRRRGENGSTDATPLEQAQALREVLATAIERLSPLGQGIAKSAPATLQYNILREEYVLGLPNKQIMVKHVISETTFHRHRREAILALAQELSRQENLLSARETAAFGSS